MLRASVQVLSGADLDEALELCDRDPVSNVFVAGRLAAHGLSRRSGGELWGYFEAGRLTSLCWSGANLVPVQANLDAADAFAAKARRQGRQCSSLVGPADVVMRMWQHLQPTWGRVRDVRADQPLMAIEGAPKIGWDPLVRPATISELGLVVPACVAMFTEEVGYSPTGADGGALYRSQVATLVRDGRSLIRTHRSAEGDSIVFKAEIGSVARGAAQVQGVWVHPSWRGLGIAAPAMAAVVDHCRRRVAPVTSLYVNAYNTRAIRVYEKVGFRQVGTFATILF